MTRREFLAGATVVAGSTLLSPSLLAASGARRMTIALTPGSIGVSVKRQRDLNELAHRHHFEAVEPMSGELAGMSPAELAGVLGDLKEKNLVWAAAGCPVDLRGGHVGFRDGLAKLPRIADGLQRAGVTRMGTWLSPSHRELTYMANFKQHATRLKEIAAVLKDHGLRLGLEYVGSQHLLVGGRYPFVHTMAETLELIAAIGTGNVGLVLDSWHWWTARDSADDIKALKSSDVVSVDLNDAPVGIDRAYQRDNQRELPMATGMIDIAAFVNALQSVGYNGPVRPEPFNRELNAMNNESACAVSSAALHRAMELVRS